MFDARTHAAIQPLLQRTAVKLIDLGVRADTMTLAGFAVGVISIICIAVGWNEIALIALLGNRLADGMDGAMARITTPTDQGAFLDITLDFIFYSGFVFGACIQDPQNAVFGAFLIFAFVANGSAFLSFAIFAEKHTIEADSASGDTFIRKSIYFLGGFAEGLETIVVFILICIAPEAFPVIAGVFGVICLLSATSRVIVGYTQLALITNKLDSDAGKR